MSFSSNQSRLQNSRDCNLSHHRIDASLSMKSPESTSKKKDITTINKISNLHGKIQRTIKSSKSFKHRIGMGQKNHEKDHGNGQLKRLATIDTLVDSSIGPSIGEKWDKLVRTSSMI